MKRKIAKSGTDGKTKRRDILSTINPDAAGIDIGSREHFVAVPEDRDEQSVRSFGCYTPDLEAMAQWLKACRVKSIVMESTGVYWRPVFQMLERHGFEVLLVDARKVKNLPGRKSDVQDCQWLQQLHTFGLLSGCYIPAREIAILRSYWRHRTELVESCAKHIHLMHKALDLMNIQLHKALSDVSGKTGMAILRAIVAGERDAQVLARMTERGVKASTEELVKALSGDYQKEHLFALKQAIELYDVFQTKIAECDQELEAYLKTFESKVEVSDKTKTSRRKNQPHFPLQTELHRITGVDLTKIDGIDSLTAQSVISEVGFSLDRFPTEKHFCSWLGLCPNNKITGGKVKSSRTKRVSNRAATALRVAAQGLHGSKSALGAFYRRMRTKLGAPKAITATAHKLARTIYRMLKFGEAFVDVGQSQYEQQYQNRVLNNLKKQAKNFGFQLSSLETGELVS